MNWNICKTLVALAVVVPGILSQSPLLNCGGDFTDVEATIYPSTNLNAGQTAYFYLSYNAPYEVSSGYVTTSLSVNGVPYPDSKSDLCQSTEFSSSGLWMDDDNAQMISDGVPCPITVGAHSRNSSFTVPNMDGSFKSKIGWFTESGTLLLCIKMLVDIVPANGRAAAW
jgi:hypothetical protein